MKVFRILYRMAVNRIKYALLGAELLLLSAAAALKEPG